MRDATEFPRVRYGIVESAQILGVSRSTIYTRIRAGALNAQKDGRRRFITASELQRYVAAQTTVGGQR